MRPDAEVAVVGAGVMGLATARALARAGRDFVVLEQFRVGHTRGSSHGASRIFRLSYADPDWVRLAEEALPGWRELEAEAGETLLVRTGLLELVRVLEESSVVGLDACGVAWELLDAAEVARRFPVRVPDGFFAVYQPDAGAVYAERALRAFGRGLRVLEETRVLAVARRDDRVELETTAGPIAARAAVVTAGAWARALLAPARIELPVVPTRQTVAYFRLEAERPVPAVVDFEPGTHSHDTYALADPNVGLKVGSHRRGPAVDPDEEGRPNPEVVARLSEWAAARFPLAEPRPVGAETCLYTSTVDERFVIERHGRLVVGSACSGHGFKFAPAVGRRLAALAVEAVS